VALKFRVQVGQVPHPDQGDGAVLQANRLLVGLAHDKVGGSRVSGKDRLSASLAENTSKAHGLYRENRRC
jgi:hypothetical protein